jgi:hypothetical protein
MPQELTRTYSLIEQAGWRVLSKGSQETFIIRKHYAKKRYEMIFFYY